MRSAGFVFAVGGFILWGCGGSGSWFDEPFWLDTDIEVVDVDGDGRSDVVTLGSWVQHGDYALGRLAVYRQTSPGVFAQPETCAADVYPWSVAFGDLDGDRFLDAVVTFPADGEIAVRRQDPGRPGSWLPETRIALAGAPYHAAIADLNGDAHGDLAVGNNAGVGGVFILLQDPAQVGTFAPPQLVATGRIVEFVAAGDLDGDLRADLVFSASSFDEVTSTTSTWLGLIFQNEDGTLGTPEYLGPVPGRSVRGLRLADLDADGRSDLVVLYGGAPGGTTALLSVLTQHDLPGSFDPPLDTDVSLSATTLFVADLDGDGHPDAGLGCWPMSPGIELYLQAGSGVPLVFGGRIAVPDSGFRGLAAGGPLDAGGLDDIAASFAGEARVAHQESPGVFDVFRPLR